MKKVVYHSFYLIKENVLICRDFKVKKDMDSIYKRRFKMLDNKEVVIYYNI